MRVRAEIIGCGLVLVLASSIAKGSSCMDQERLSESPEALRVMMRNETPVLADVTASLDGRELSHHIKVKVLESFGDSKTFSEIWIRELDRPLMIGHVGVKVGDRRLFFVGLEFKFELQR